MKPPISRIAAFSLVEVAIATAVTSFCLIALIGLLPVGMKNNQASIEQTAANGILSEITADLRSAAVMSPPGQRNPSLASGIQAVTQQFAIPIPANPVTASPAQTTLYFTSTGQSSAEPTGTVTDPWNFLVTITFLTNGTNPKNATFVKLQISWPASVTPANAIGSVQTFVALDRN